ncbi:ornithine cyclodeaminase family protein [Desulfovirgula thermocuniculi]|uniref:ornithine cyclodeaminase family protein n=1 Tax=Desulfovirgula thermocuniculi TaxID=348842 RepID=UPI000415A308|nr:ornithine cyclodeaminase family protein [Desulfovirgula thermocuniculi]
MKKGKEVLYLSGADVRKIGLSMAETMEAVEQALFEKGRGNCQMPPKPGIFTQPDAFIHAMPAYIPALGAAGLKWVAGYPGNTRHGLPYLNGLLILNCPETGVPLAVMDCVWITAQRTGAVSGIAAKYLARQDSEVLAIIGCGVQARTQLEALALVRRLKVVKCYDINPGQTSLFIEEMKARLPHLEYVAAGSAREAVQEADIVVTATPILKEPRPPIELGWLKEGVLGLPIDFDSYWQPEAMQGCDKFYVDDENQFEYYRTLGYFRGAPKAYADLGQLVTGKVPARESERERIISMNLGLAIEDMATAIRIYQKALEQGIGTLLPL